MIRGKTKLLIIKEEGDEIRHIANTEEVDNDSLINIQEVIEATISYTFKDIKCPICTELFSAIIFSQSPLGNICKFCWSNHEPTLKWEPIDNLETYIKKEYKR